MDNDLLSAQIEGELSHSINSVHAPMRLFSGARPNHRFESFPDSFFMGQIEMDAGVTLCAGEAAPARVKIIAPKELKSLFVANARWEVTIAGKPIGYFTIREVEWL